MKSCDNCKKSVKLWVRLKQLFLFITYFNININNLGGTAHPFLGMFVCLFVCFFVAL